MCNARVTRRFLPARFRAMVVAGAELREAGHEAHRDLLRRNLEPVGREVPHECCEAGIGGAAEIGRRGCPARDLRAGRGHGAGRYGARPVARPQGRRRLRTGAEPEPRGRLPQPRLRLRARRRNLSLRLLSGRLHRAVARGLHPLGRHSDTRQRRAHPQGPRPLPLADALHPSRPRAQLRLPARLRARRRYEREGGRVACHERASAWPPPDRRLCRRLGHGGRARGAGASVAAGLALQRPAPVPRCGPVAQRGVRPPRSGRGRAAAQLRADAVGQCREAERWRCGRGRGPALSPGMVPGHPRIGRGRGRHHRAVERRRRLDRRGGDGAGGWSSTRR
jgi:hypothetical protein